MTPDEKASVDRARALAKLQARDRRAKQSANLKTGRQRVAEHEDRDRLIELPPVADPKRRARLEKDLPKWLRQYMPAAFPYPFSAGHLALIRNTEHAAMTGEGTATAQPRGEGKTTVLRGVCINLVVRGIVRFPVLVGWKHQDAKSAFKMWLRMLCDSPEFAADYPEICAPFIHSTHATALKSLRWAHNHEKIGAMVDTQDKIVVLPDSLGAIAARSAQGDAKGLNVTLPDGTVLRPDFLLIDDAQNPDQAANPNHVAGVVDSLENVFMGMAGPQKRLSAAAACTVEAEGDVSCHFLTRHGWTSTRISRVEAWPDGSDGGTWETKADDPIKAAWDEWRDLYLATGQKAANAYFRRNRKAMTGKMRVSWKHRFEPGKDVCAIDAAMREWYDKGEDVFSRGQQNRPLKRGVDVFRLTSDIVASRWTDRAPGVAPDWAEVIAAGTDINPSLYLSTAVGGFGRDMTAAVMWYGRWDKAPLPTNDKMSRTEFDAAVYGALVKQGDKLLTMPRRPQIWVIDANGDQARAVRRFGLEWNARHTEMPCMPAYGRSGKTARLSARNETIRRRGEQWFLCRDRDPEFLRQIEWTIYHSDYWKEVAQRAWTCEIGAPGGATLPTGQHFEFGAECANERLLDKAELSGRVVWDYQVIGRHDYGDAWYMAYVGASLCGVGTGGPGAKAERKTLPPGAMMARRAERHKIGARYA